jgi:hypothetical protein
MCCTAILDFESIDEAVAVFGVAIISRLFLLGL